MTFRTSRRSSAQLERERGGGGAHYLYICQANLPPLAPKVHAYFLFPVLHAVKVTLSVFTSKKQHLPLFVFIARYIEVRIDLATCCLKLTYCRVAIRLQVA